MAAILEETLSKLCEVSKDIMGKLRNSKRVVKISCFLIIGLISVFVCLAGSGATLAYKVSLEGEVIATVKSKKQYSTALNMVKERVGEQEVEKVVSAPKYTAAVVHNSVIDSESKVAEAIIETTDNIVSAVLIKVDGSEVAKVQYDGVEAVVEEYKNSFAVEGVDCTCTLAQKIETENVYCLKEELSDVDALKGRLCELTVITETTVVSDSEIPYKTVYKSVSNRLKGDSSVVIAGFKGLRQVTRKVTYINGVLSADETVSDVVVREPSDAVVEVGTARSIASSAERSEAYSSGFIFPLPNGSWRISSYFGDGRGHQGLDICAAKGTSIFAVKDGTVTYAGYDGAYGYCVVIDHGNGLTTRYAHASSLCVSVGEKVATGDVIARVGSTGRSSGNHLHFEVAKGGKRVDPAPYIGLD